MCHFLPIHFQIYFMLDNNTKFLLDHGCNMKNVKLSMRCICIDTQFDHASENHPFCVCVFALAPPVFIKTPPTFVEVLLGDSLTLSCGAHGNPRPTVVWHKDESPIEKHEKIKVSSINRQPCRDLNKYSCNLCFIIVHFLGAQRYSVSCHCHKKYFWSL